MNGDSSHGSLGRDESDSRPTGSSSASLANMHYA